MNDTNSLQYSLVAIAWDDSIPGDSGLVLLKP